MKGDLKIDINNLGINSGYEIGYSSSSYLGASSTLINANKDGSNFVYRVIGINEEQIKYFNSLDKFKAKFEYLRSIGATWHFVHAASDVLRNNLMMLDTGLEAIVASCLEKYYTGVARTLREISNLVTKENPLNLCLTDHQPMYDYKIKQFLLAFALGMTVTTPWMGKFNANGGYIVVKEDGDIVCYHFFDRNDLEDYLFNNTIFDTPSTSRHGFGSIYKEGEDTYIKLGLQIRFIK